MKDFLFRRTECACADCVEPCKRQPGPLAPGDIEPIAVYLGVTVRDVLGKFWASPGAVLRNSETGVITQVGTITPRLKNGRCVFLDAADRCSIHFAAPFGCAYYDTHMSEAEANRRGVWLYTRIAQDQEYQSLRRTLAPATSWRPR